MTTEDARTFVPARDLAVIACERPSRTAKDHRRIMGVRWASRPDLGFPRDGYALSRHTGDARTELGVFWLPRTDTWAAFRADAIARAPLAGPYFPTIEVDNLGHLLPLIRFADPRTSEAEAEGLTSHAAEFFGGSHADSAPLAWTLWPFKETPPPLAALLGDPASRATLIAFYRQRATDYLLALALRFEYAVLFGLAVDDAAWGHSVAYEVRASWPAGKGAVQTDPKLGDRVCRVDAPPWLIADRTPGSVAHPAFGAWAGWSPPVELAPVDGDGRPVPADALVPRVPAAFSALTWPHLPPPTSLIGHGPVLYRVGRFDFGAPTASMPNPPPLPPDAAFRTLTPGEDLLPAAGGPSFQDLPGMSWPPLEGHYVYSVRGVNLLGIESEADVRALLRHHDDMRPIAPPMRVVSGPSGLLGADDAIEIQVGFDWSTPEDFVSPDVTAFRLACSWTPTSCVELRIMTVSDAPPLHAELTVEAVTAAADTWVGARLCTSRGDYPIVSHGSGSPAPMRVRRVRGRAPSPGELGVLFVPGVPTPRTRVAEVRRRSAATAQVALVASIEPLVLHLQPLAGAPSLPAEPVRLYLHLFRSTFAAAPSGDGWLVHAPGNEDAARPQWDRWRSMADPHQALIGSPALIFPGQELKCRVTAPPGFTGGLLELSASAADATAYVASPALPATDPTLLGLRGNESAATVASVAVRSTRAPVAPVVIGANPGERLWATSAAVFDEDATFTVRWMPASGALRYEVWRALGTDDPMAFSLRGQTFDRAFTDALPGRAPTTAFYRIRSVGPNGVVGPYSAALGPVFVPDVRPPPRPNFTRACALPSEEGAGCAIALEWTQSGIVDNVSFLVERRDGLFRIVGSVPIGAPRGPGGVYRFIDTTCDAGRSYEYRIRAVREVADPVDPAGHAIRRIEGPASASGRGTAFDTRPLPAPRELVGAVQPGTQAVTLSWVNGAQYDRIVIRRRRAGDHVFLSLASVAGGAVTYVDPSAPAGTWHYQLRAQAPQRQATSADVVVEVS